MVMLCETLVLPGAIKSKHTLQSHNCYTKLLQAIVHGIPNDLNVPPVSHNKGHEHTMTQHALLHCRRLQVFMISYMLDRKGFLLVNREVVGGDVDDFEFSPKPEFDGPFTVVNLENEEKLLRHWFDHLRQVWLVMPADIHQRDPVY